jgi:hypothetical protein
MDDSDSNQGTATIIVKKALYLFFRGLSFVGKARALNNI